MCIRDRFKAGLYVDITTGEPLFVSSHKFNSHCGWPSFTKPIAKDVIKYYQDDSHGMNRIEVRSRIGNAHLGLSLIHIYPNHHDRIVFMRICSGKFEKGMSVLHRQSNKTIRLSQPQQFLATERTIVEDAYPGDIIGVFDAGDVYKRQGIYV